MFRYDKFLNMKNLLLLLSFAVIFSCKKDKETVNSTIIPAPDSIQIPTIQNPDQSGAFEIIPQNIAAEKGRAVFSQNGKVLFYFDQNSNNGNVSIEGKDYALNRFDFTENNYSISGNGIKIEAANGDFKDGTGDCLYGSFPEVKVSANGKTLNLPNIEVQDCPDY